MDEVRLINANALCRHIQDWKTRCQELHRHSVGMYHMMIYEVLRQVLNVINDTPTIDPESLRPTWRDPEKNPPKVETEVLVLVDCGKGYCITTAFYEDGTVSQYESLWQWEDVDDYGIYDEEEDLYRLPKGWREYRHFTPDDELECPIDKPVVGWMPLPEKVLKNDDNSV